MLNAARVLHISKIMLTFAAQNKQQQKNKGL